MDIDGLFNKIVNCDQCNNVLRPPVPFEINNDFKFFIIGRNPGAEEYKACRPFVGPSGRLLWDILKNYCGIERNDCFITNTVKCFRENDDRPNKLNYGNCRGFLKEELNIFKDKLLKNDVYLLALGNDAFNELFPDSQVKSILKLNSFIIKNNPIIGVLPHPSYFLYRMNYLSVFLNDQRFVKLADVFKEHKYK